MKISEELRYLTVFPALFLEERHPYSPFSLLLCQEGPVDVYKRQTLTREKDIKPELVINEDSN